MTQAVTREANHEEQRYQVLPPQTSRLFAGTPDRPGAVVRRRETRFDGSNRGLDAQNFLPSRPAESK